MEERIPTSREFAECCREAFRELLARGFTLEPEAEFQWCVRSPQLRLVIRGEGYGTVASLSVACGTAAPVPTALLVPQGQRRKPPSGQLAQIRFEASEFITHCADIIGGNHERLLLAHAEWERKLAALRRRPGTPAA